MVFWCLRFLPKNERKQVDLRYHSSKVEFVDSFFGRIVGLKKSLRLCLTFNYAFTYELFRQRISGPRRIQFGSLGAFRANVDLAKTIAMTSQTGGFRSICHRSEVEIQLLACPQLLQIGCRDTTVSMPIVVEFQEENVCILLQ